MTAISSEFLRLIRHPTANGTSYESSAIYKKFAELQSCERRDHRFQGKPNSGVANTEQCESKIVAMEPKNDNVRAALQY